MNKIVFFLPAFYSPKCRNSSGGTISNYLMIRQLSNYYKINIVSPDVKVDPILNENISCITTNQYVGISLYNKLKKIKWYSDSIKNYFAKNKPDVAVYTNTTNLFFNRKKCKKNILLVRAYEDFFSIKMAGENKVESLVRRMKKTLLTKKIHKVYNEVDIIITNSNYMRDKIIKEFEITQPEKIKVVYPPIDMSPSHPYKNISNIARRVTIGMINPSPAKGDFIFIGLAKKFPNVNFMYFSKNNKQYQLENIIYGGWISDRSSLFSKIDLLIVPSQWPEPFGRVSVEAIRSGLPVIVSGSGGLTETVDKLFVIEKYDCIDEWVNKVEWAFNNTDILENTWSKSLEVSEQFVTEQHEKSLLEIFHS
ncbi:glycosyltransferase family 4 protein [Klebsiella pneumoniae]